MTQEIKNIDKYDKIKQEATDLVESVKKTVASSTGAEGEALLRENKRVLQAKRLEIVGFLKQERDGLIKAQKSIVAVEKDVLKIFDEGEAPLTLKIKEINEAREIEKRKKVLPERLEALKEIDVEVPEEDLLKISDKEFAIFFQEKKGEWLEKKAIAAEEKRLADEKKMQEEKDKLAEEKRKFDEDKRILEAEKKAKKDAEAQAKLDSEAALAKVEKDKVDALAKAEKDKDDARIKAEKYKQDLRIQRIISLGLIFDGNNFIMDDFNVHHTELLLSDDEFEKMVLKISDEIKRREIAKEKQDIIDEQKLKDEKRIADEKKKEDERIAVEKKEAEAKARLEAGKQYQKFLQDNNYDAFTDYIIEKDDKNILYRKVAEFTKE